jgi:hypothetical protein
MYIARHAMRMLDHEQLATTSRQGYRLAICCNNILRLVLGYLNGTLLLGSITTKNICASHHHKAYDKQTWYQY